ncbi:hypothetical protein KBC80_04440 [Candidatus Woesebacteria bacterium]|nr:hypothetical protein [Candidatus Woesebacteria bacterium]
MRFFRKYWYLLIVTIITIGIGVVAYLTSTKLEQQTSVAPNVPQVTPKASNNPDCKLVFSLTINTPTPTPTGVQNTPTPTPTGVQNTPTPTPTGVQNTPTPTPTGQANRPECVELTLSPSTGTIPYTTTLTCTGTIVGGDITAAEFTLPDGTTKLVEKNVGNPGSISFDYTVGQSGSLSFSCRVRDNNFNFSGVSDACRKSVGPTPTGAPTATPSPIPTPKIPVAGTGPSILGAATVAGGLLLLLFGLAF